MNDSCRRFDALIARSAQLTTEEAAVLEAHLAGCGSCRELARALKPVDDDVALSATGVAETMMTGDPRANATMARHDHQLPEVITDRYRITGEVGRGGIGRVLHALDQVLDRPVALKELFSANDAMRRRFIREALITARLQHPSIVPVYDAGHLGDRSPFYAMKLVAGQPLDRSIADATTLAQRLALLPSVLAVADAMAYAHSERIIHRDLKPMNVLVGKYGETIVIDWGLAKDLAVDDRDALDAGPYRAADLDHTVAGAVLGTPAYMAPEQAAGEAVDERADVYALGAILYHVVSGAIPHEGNTLEEMVGRVISGDVRPLTEREPEIPRDLAAIVHKAMALAPSERYANAQRLADDLRRFLNGQLVASHRYATRELVRRWIKRHRAAVTVALSALVVVGTVGIVSVMGTVRARQQAETELADLLTEQGRQELLAGRPARAAVYLSQAYAQSRAPTAALRSALAEAMHSIEARMALEGHTSPLTSAAFSPDGTRVVTASLDNTARVWDVATGVVVATLLGDVNQSVSFSPDNSRIVTAGQRGLVRLWDARTGKLVVRFDRVDDVQSAALSPDGARVITTGDNGIAKLWDAKTAQLLVSFEGHHDRVYAAAFSHDGARAVTASADHTAKVWDVKTGELLLSFEGGRAAFSPDGSQIVTVGDTARLRDARTGTLLASLEGHSGPVSSAAYSPDGSRLVTAGDDRTAKLWDARTGKLLISLGGHAGAVHSAVFSPDGSRVVTASYDHTARLWDVRTGRLLASFEGHRDDVKSAMFSPDGTQILTASADGTARLWDATPGAAKLWDATPSKLRASLDGDAGRTTHVVLSRGGARLVTTAKDDHAARLWDARSGKLLGSLDGHRGEIVMTNFDFAGTHVITVSSDHTVRLWDANTGELLVTFDDADGVDFAMSSQDGARVLTKGGDHGARIWNAQNGELIARLDGTKLPHLLGYPDHVYWATFSRDGHLVATTSGDGTGRIWRADKGSLVAQLDGHIDSVLWVAFSRDGARVATTSSDRTAKVWDARTGKLLASLGHTGAVFYAEFSPDGTRVATASVDHTAKLWDAQTGKLLASFDGHTNVVFSARFSPDPEDARVMTQSMDHTLKLWDARTGKLLASLDVPPDVQSTGFSPDGARVLIASGDGTIWTWDVHLETRTPEAIQRIISARDPWTLTNGGLVPVPVAFDSVVPKVDDQGGATHENATADAVTSADDRATRTAAMFKRLIDAFMETDCEKVAAKLRSILDSNRAQFVALAAKPHDIDQAAMVRAMLPIAKEIRDKKARLEDMNRTCQHNKAIRDAMDALMAVVPR